MSILPYPRNYDPDFFANSDIPATMNMIDEPYKVEKLTSPSDSSSYHVEDWYINPRYRYSQYTYLEQPEYKDILSPDSVGYISFEITVRLKGVHPDGKDIVVPDTAIRSVIDSFWNMGYQLNSVFQEQVIMYIVEYIKNEFQLIEQNNKLSAWVQTYSQDTGLKQFNGIKLSERRWSKYYHWNY